MAQVRLGSGLGRIRVPKPLKSSVVAKRVFCTWSRREPVLWPTRVYYQQGEGAAVVVIRAWFVRMNMWTYEYVDVLTHVRIIVMD